ncbi:HetP family heterocyst commitment protein [Cylindrospermum sp. FACHB-282]|uniref:HetP family heterocyst commitment protein n=1 Tax=Cylindrospermum sp. FACHB-282 TaxID=2692794 RepID=UPI0016825530|nr:HetP family heterocyst commitment protein [Cylindrospermum sp. FACHB-282]MBD2386074.1 HetP family heterocyst commitment protein [Cylindrospermum sp. FACHB-282]
MNYQLSSSPNNLLGSITPEQLNQVIEAITEGRYSWACVLILRFIGYNPLHYIPQRTYSRLIKENRQVMNPPASTKQKLAVNMKSSMNSSIHRDSSKVLSKIN